MTNQVSLKSKIGSPLVGLSSVRLLRIQDVCSRVGLSRSQVYKLMSEGRFPRQIRLGERASAWLEAEIDEWIAGRVAASRTEVVK